MSYTKEQMDEYLKSMRSTPQGAKYTDEQWAEYADHLRDQHQENALKGLGRKGLDYGVRALDYAGGLTRTGAAELGGLTKEGDWSRAVKGQAPPTDELLERMGVESGGSLSDVVPGIYSETGDGLALQKGGPLDPTARGAAGFVGDIALDPLTYLSMGASAAAKTAGKGASTTVKTSRMVLNPVEALLEKSGKGMYKSGMKGLDKATRLKGKADVSDTLLKYGVRGSSEQVKKQAYDLMSALKNQQDQILTKADDLGATVNVPAQMADAQSLVDDMVRSNDPALRDTAAALQTKINEYLDLGKPREVPTGRSIPLQGDTVDVFGKVRQNLDPELAHSTKVEWTPEMIMQPPAPIKAGQASGFKTSLYQTLPDSAFNKATTTAPGQRVQKEMARGLKEGVENSVELVEPGLGAQLRGTNYDLGELLTARKALMTEAEKEATKNALTSVDALAASVSPLAFVAKKAADVSKTSGFRTRTGYRMYQTGKNSKGLVDSAARRSFWEMLGLPEPTEEEK